MHKDDDRTRRTFIRRLRRGAGVASLALLVFVMLAPGARAHIGETFSHLWNQHLAPLLTAPGTINAAENPVHWTKLAGVPAGLADGLDNGVDRAGFGLERNVVIGGGLEFAVDPTVVQRRLSASCGAGSALQGVAQSGQVTCSRGPAGYETAIDDTGGIANTWATEGTLHVPAGTWAVTAKIAVSSGSHDIGYYADCRLDIPGQTFVDAATLYSDNPYYSETMPLQGIVTLAAEGDIALVCQDHGSWTLGGWLRIQAIRLGN